MTSLLSNREKSEKQSILFLFSQKVIMNTCKREDFFITLIKGFSGSTVPSPRTQPTTSARHSSPPSPTSIASRRPGDLRRHDLTVDGSHEQHKAQGSKDFTHIHNGHHQIQHKCYHWREEVSKWKALGVVLKNNSKKSINYFYRKSIVLPSTPATAHDSLPRDLPAH